MNVIFDVITKLQLGVLTAVLDFTFSSLLRGEARVNPGKVCCISKRCYMPFHAATLKAGIFDPLREFEKHQNNSFIVVIHAEE